MRRLRSEAGEGSLARKGSGFTLLMDSLIVLMAQHMTVTAIAEMIDEHDTRIWRVLEYYVMEARSHQDFSKVKSVGVDETSRRKDINMFQYL